MRNIYKYILVALMIVLQATLFRYISFFGVKPDVVFIVVLGFSLLNGSAEAIILCLFAGLLQDILYNSAIGVVTLPLLIVCYITGLISKSVFRENTFVAFVFVFSGTLLYNLIVMFSMVLMKYEFNFIKSFIDIALLQAIYNSIITIFGYKYLIALNKYINETRKKLFKNI